MPRHLRIPICSALLAGLTLSSCAPTAGSGGGTLLVQRCNLADGGPMQTGLRVAYQGFYQWAPIGENGLTRSIAGRGSSAAEWAQRTFPETAAASRYSYSATCGRSFDHDDD
ncbi:MAG: hypothetical protein AAF667_02925 [Pseudomonadota bacterium]